MLGELRRNLIEDRYHLVGYLTSIIEDVVTIDGQHIALGSIYGIELLPDNAAACRQRLYSYFCEQYERLFGDACKPACRKAVEFLLERNIIMGDALTYRRVDHPDEWIVVSEWSFIGDGKVVRRDYSFSYLVATGQGGDLFSDTPCDTFPPVYFLNLNQQAYEN